MTEQIVIHSSRLRVASIDILWVFIGLIWPALYILTIHPADHIGGFFKVLFALCALAGGAVALRAAQKMWRILNTTGHWKATVNAQKLKWEAAIPCENLPMEIDLADIAKALRLETLRTGKDSDGEYTEATDSFELHLIDEQVLTFDRESTGINPHRVFLALAKRGIRYELWSADHTKGSVNTSKVFQRAY